MTIKDKLKKITNVVTLLEKKGDSEDFTLEELCKLDAYLGELDQCIEKLDKDLHKAYGACKIALSQDPPIPLSVKEEVFLNKTLENLTAIINLMYSLLTLFYNTCLASPEIEPALEAELDDILLDTTVKLKSMLDYISTCQHTYKLLLPNIAKVTSKDVKVVLDSTEVLFSYNESLSGYTQACLMLIAKEISEEITEPKEPKEPKEPTKEV